MFFLQCNVSRDDNNSKQTTKFVLERLKTDDYHNGVTYHMTNESHGAGEIRLRTYLQINERGYSTRISFILGTQHLILFELLCYWNLKCPSERVLIRTFLNSVWIFARYKKMYTRPYVHVILMYNFSNLKLNKKSLSCLKHNYALVTVSNRSKLRRKTCFGTANIKIKTKRRQTLMKCKIFRIKTKIVKQKL